jgi:hypothetical protein
MEDKAAASRALREADRKQAEKALRASRKEARRVEKEREARRAKELGQWRSGCLGSVSWCRA